MHRRTRCIAALALALLNGVGGLAAAAPAEVFSYGRFGEVSIYRGRGEAREVALLLSGEGGWTAAVAAMAERLAERNVLVAGIDLRHYLGALDKAAESCVSPAADLENLSHYLQAKLGLPAYIEPTLVGYSAGATLAYGTLAQAPAGLFKGALSLGFCPDVELAKPLCPGMALQAAPRHDEHGAPKGVALLPAKHLSGRWIALQGELDQACPAPLTRQFVQAVPGAEIVMLPKVGHGYAVERNWLPQYQSAFDRVSGSGPAPAAAPEALPPPVADLPLKIVPASRGTANPWFAVFLSGDGGWVGIDKGVSAALARHDIPVVGWDSLKYFWSPRTPQGSAQDLDRVVKTYSAAWRRSRVVLIGFSQGADTLPFMVNRLPPATRSMVDLTVLLGISDNALFEFHLANWLGTPPKGLPTAPELAAWSGSPYLCLYGEADGDAACETVAGHDGRVVKMPGGHHFGGGYSAVAEQILESLPRS